MVDTEDFDLNEKVKEKLEANEKRKRDTEITDLKFVGKTAQGRRVLYRILSSTGCFRENTCGDSRVFFVEGRRSIGLEIFRDLDKECVLQLTLENDALESQRLKELEDVKSGK